MAAVLLDDDGFRVRGLARDRQSDADGGDSSKSQNELTHANFSSGVDSASTPKARTRSIFCSEPSFIERPNHTKVAAGNDSERTTPPPVNPTQRRPSPWRAESPPRPGAASPAYRSRRR